MEPEHLHFGGGAADTVLHPLVAVVMIIAVLLILTLPRNKAIVPFLLAFFSIPPEQVLVLGGLHFTVLRVLILAGLVRLIFYRKGEGRFAGGFNSLDLVIVLWTIVALVVINLQWLEKDMLVKSLGDFLEALGGFLAVRFLIPDGVTLRRTVKVLAVICVIQGVCMVSEQFTHQNVFNFIGGRTPDLRDGHIRSEGVMGTLYGGAFAGVLIPVFLWLWTERKSRLAACAGLAGATAMVFASHASTSWGAYGAGLVGLAFWPLRKQMGLVRLGIVVLLLSLHVVMHGPVWSLIEKIDLTGGSSNFHRYMLVDNCIRHFGDWWFLGYKYYSLWGFDMWDLCNQFVVTALTGGLATFVLYILIFKRAFDMLGTARKQVEGNHEKEWFYWCLGALLFANVVASFGINYMIQLQAFFATMLACISIASLEAKQELVPGAQKALAQNDGVQSVRGWGMKEAKP